LRRVINQMKMHGQMVANTNNVPNKFGIVSGYDPDNYCCKVLLKPEDTMTGWLPIASPWVGSNWGLFMPPSIGDVVDVNFQEGSQDAGYVSTRFFDNESRPVHCESGVFYLIHKSGSSIKFNNDGSADFITDSDLRAIVGGNLTADIVGKATVTANLVDIDGGGPLSGCINGLSMCHFTGNPMADVSATVKVSK